MSEEKPDPENDAPPRRSFLVRVGALLVGGLAGVVPVAAATTSLLDPLRKRRSESAMVLVARVSSVPEDGTPKKFTVTADRTDAWESHRNTPVGAVYLRRTDSGVEALNVVCPHAGCFVGLADDKTRFACPCHKSSFDLDGVINDPASPAPRNMDALEVDVRNGDEVWVRFQNFLPGREGKTAV